MRVRLIAWVTRLRLSLARFFHPARRRWVSPRVHQWLQPWRLTDLMAMARYATPGKSEAWWVVTIADYNAPTAAELNAGVDLTGFSRVLPSVPRGLNTVDIADLSSKYEKRQVGTRGGDILTWEVFRDDATDTGVDTLTEDTAGFMVLARKGLATTGTFAIGDEVDVYPSTVGAAEDASPGRNDPDMSTVRLVATDDPNRGFALAA